jgi:hypothetical protein
MSLKKPSSPSLFTIENLLAQSQGELKPFKKRTEGWEWWEFVSLFRDGTGIVSGGFWKESKQIIGLTIFGNGPTWIKVVSAAALLAIGDEVKADATTTKLGAFKSSGARLKELEQDDTKFQMARFPDGQLLFKIRHMDQLPVVRTRAVAVALPSRPATDARTKSTRSKALSSLKFPNFKTELKVFKKRFAEWIDSFESDTVIQPPRQHSARGALHYTFGKETVLMVFAGDQINVSQILIDSTTSECAEFWFCLEATIVALNPRMSTSNRQEILHKLGKRKTNALPKGDKELDDRNSNYTYGRNGNLCVLQIWPARR